MQDSFDLIFLFRAAWKWKKSILGVCTLALVGSIIISHPAIMPPYFKSVSVIFPSNPSLLDRQVLFKVEGGDKPTNFFGTKEDVDRILSIANSAKLSSWAIREFSLFSHYQIDSNKVDYPFTAVMREFRGNYEALKNEYGAVEIRLYDTDRHLASEMVNKIVEKIDDINLQLIMEHKKKTISMFKARLQKKQTEVNSLADSLSRFQENYNFLISESGGSAENSEGQLKVRLIRGSASKIPPAAWEKVKLIASKKDKAVQELNDISTIYEQMEATTNRDLSSLYIMEKAYPAEKKSSPVRWLIVSGTLLAAFILSLLFAAFTEKIKKVDWNELSR